MSFEGIGLVQRNDANEKFYGGQYTTLDVLYSNPGKLTPVDNGGKAAVNQLHEVCAGGCCSLYDKFSQGPFLHVLCGRRYPDICLHFPFIFRCCRYLQYCRCSLELRKQYSQNARYMRDHAGAQAAGPRSGDQRIKVGAEPVCDHSNNNVCVSFG